MADAAQTMFDNLKAKTGKEKEFWINQVNECGLEKHGEIIKFLKETHGIGHGYANMITHVARDTSSLNADGDELITAQYKGKENLKPIYAAIVNAVNNIGTDYELSPKKAGVSFRRKKQFILVEPKTKTRIDLGINLKGHEGNDRLQLKGGMCTHMVALFAVEEIDEELLRWIDQSYHAAG